MSTKNCDMYIYYCSYSMLVSKSHTFHCTYQKLSHLSSDRHSGRRPSSQRNCQRVAIFYDNKVGYFLMSGTSFSSCTSGLIFRQRLDLNKTMLFCSQRNLSWKKVTRIENAKKWPNGFSFNHWFPDFIPTCIHLIKMKHAMPLFIVLPYMRFLEFSKNSSPDFPPLWTGLPRLVLHILDQLAFV